MRTGKLGNSDLRITPVGYGAWAIGGSSVSVTSSRAIIPAGVIASSRRRCVGLQTRASIRARVATFHRRVTAIGRRR